MFKQFISCGLLSSALVLTNSLSAHATTFLLSGFSVSDGVNTYSAEGSFEWDGGALSTLSQNDLQIQNTFNLEVSNGQGYTMTLDSGNIDFTLSTINGMVNSDNSVVNFSSIDIVDTSFNLLLSDDGFDQSYDDLSNFISLSTLSGYIGTPFNPATAQATTTPEPSNILSLGLLTFGFLTFTVTRHLSRFRLIGKDS